MQIANKIVPGTNARVIIKVKHLQLKNAESYAILIYNFHMHSQTFVEKQWKAQQSKTKESKA